VADADLPPTHQRVAALLRHEFSGLELTDVASEYPGTRAPGAALRLRLGHRLWLDLADDGREWFVAGLYADASGVTPPDQRSRESLAVPLDAEARVVADAAVASVWRWVDAVGPAEADAPFARERPAAPPAIPSPAVFGAPAPAPYVPQPAQPLTPPPGAWAGQGAGQPAPNAYVPQAAPGASPYGGPGGYGAAPAYGAWAPAAPAKPRNRGLLIGGIIAASVLVLGGVSAAVLSGIDTLSSEVAAGPDPGIDPDAVPDTGIEELTVGDCFSFGGADATAEEVSMVDLRSCDEEHQNEVYLQDELTDADAYPGDEETAAEADDLCYGAFEGFIGLPWEESEVEYLYLTPTEQSWGQGDRSVLCYAYLFGDTSPGTLQDYGY